MERPGGEDAARFREEDADLRPRHDHEVGIPVPVEIAEDRVAQAPGGYLRRGSEEGAVGKGDEERKRAIDERHHVGAPVCVDVAYRNTAWNAESGWIRHGA